MTTAALFEKILYICTTRTVKGLMLKSAHMCVCVCVCVCKCMHMTVYMHTHMCAWVCLKVVTFLDGAADLLPPSDRQMSLANQRLHTNTTS